MYKTVKSQLKNNQSPFTTTSTKNKTSLQSFPSISTKSIKSHNSLFSLPKRAFSFKNSAPSLHPALKAILGVNAFIYFIGWPMDMNTYIRSFFFNKENLSARPFSLITCHFAKTGIVDLVLESAITAMIGSTTVMMAGEVLFKKLVLGSVIISSVILMLRRDDGVFYKSEAISRGLIMYLISVNPQASFMLFPFPVQVKALYLGVGMVLIDLLSGKHCNFGGYIAAVMLSRGMIK